MSSFVPVTPTYDDFPTIKDIYSLNIAYKRQKAVFYYLEFFRNQGYSESSKN